LGLVTDNCARMQIFVNKLSQALFHIYKKKMFRLVQAPFVRPCLFGRV
jgi:hypothetical protein